MSSGENTFKELQQYCLYSRTHLHFCLQQQKILILQLCFYRYPPHNNTAHHATTINTHSSALRRDTKQCTTE